MKNDIRDHVTETEAMFISKLEQVKIYQETLILKENIQKIFIYKIIKGEHNFLNNVGC